MANVDGPALDARHGYPPATAVRALFGDLHNALRASGDRRPPERTRFDVNAARCGLRRFDEAHGRHPSAREWDELGQRPSASAIIRHFGSWNAALSAAGLTVTRPRRRWSDDEILAAIREFEARHQRPPAAADFGGGALPGFETVRVRLGSLGAVLTRAQATRPD